MAYIPIDTDRFTEGPGFESQLGHVFFSLALLLLTHMVIDNFRVSRFEPGVFTIIVKVSRVGGLYKRP